MMWQLNWATFSSSDLTKGFSSFLLMLLFSVKFLNTLLCFVSWGQGWPFCLSFFILQMFWTTKESKPKSHKWTVINSSIIIRWMDSYWRLNLGWPVGELTLTRLSQLHWQLNQGWPVGKLTLTMLSRLHWVKPGLTCRQTHLDHAVPTPAFHPLDSALLVEGRVGLTVQCEVGVGVVHDQDDVKVGQHPCVNQT